MSASLIDAVRLDPTYGINTPTHLEGDEQRDLLRVMKPDFQPRTSRRCDPVHCGIVVQLGNEPR